MLKLEITVPQLRDIEHKFPANCTITSDVTLRYCSEPVHQFQVDVKTDLDPTANSLAHCMDIIKWMQVPIVISELGVFTENGFMEKEHLIAQYLSPEIQWGTQFYAQILHSAIWGNQTELYRKYKINRLLGI